MGTRELPACLLLILCTCASFLCGWGVPDADRDGDGFFCRLSVPSGLESSACEDTKLLFPSTDDILFRMRGQTKVGTPVLVHETPDGQPRLLLSLVVHEDRMEEAVERGIADQYLNLSDVSGLWEIATVELQPLAVHPVESIGDAQSLLPPMEAEWSHCGKGINLQIECEGKEWPPEAVETGAEGAPCTLLGKCDEGFVCVEKSMFLRQCTEEEKAAEGGEVKIVSGPQPAAPFGNCFFAPEERKCAVEGDRCFLNKRFKHYAQCRPAWDCPKPSAHLVMRDALGQVDLHSERSLSGSRRRLHEVAGGGRGGGGSPGEMRRRLRKLQECLREEVLDGGEDDEWETAATRFGTTAAEGVEHIAKIATERCAEWLDVSAVDPIRPASPSSRPEEAEDLSLDGTSFASADEDDIIEDAGWTLGWECDAPLGAAASSSGGAMSREEARVLVKDLGLSEDVAVPSEEEASQGSELSALFDPAFVPSEASMQTSQPILPTPPPKKKFKQPVYKCGKKVPLYGRAPTMSLAPVLICAPTFLNAPLVTMGPTFVFGPLFVNAPTTTGGPLFFGCPFFVNAVTTSLSFELILGDTYILAPELILAPVHIVAPTFLLMPHAILAPATIVTPLFVTPDIFADWVLERTDFGPSKVKRFDGAPRIPAKDAKVDPASLVNFIYSDVTPVNEIAATVQAQELPSLPLSTKKAEAIGLRRSIALGDLFLIVLAPTVVCARKTIEGNVRAIVFLPFDARTTNFHPENKCVVAYPSDVLRDIPQMPKALAPAIRLFESAENLIPPSVKVAANQVLGLVQVVGEGGIPDIPKWVSSLIAYAKEEPEDHPEREGKSGETRFRGSQVESSEGANKNATVRESKNEFKPSNSVHDFQRAVAFVTENIGQEGAEKLPSLFPKDSRIVKLAYEMTNGDFFSEEMSSLMSFADTSLFRKEMKPERGNEASPLHVISSKRSRSEDNELSSKDGSVGGLGGGRPLDLSKLSASEALKGIFR
uniref:Uncharacterized protein n=1 Tax=Chromera velia CCMP2878 TaxID=1169474 RepID=A0A0G4HJA4_9ALVE|eukprot:Cvel_7049.t1-p1 / transcript=Cvel_7049.t1 / gene=Cvel_7049 / organism=Chromera_velia_CCMP2878 / gene_product=hypothetical protein / transcript_product=hypothetical protein / location=Cvel_scaffold360:11416-16718(+) / protein_length=994 / sequence_SO=supercontig / SO=protein_coding / is_pseudo=false